MSRRVGSSRKLRVPWHGRVACARSAAALRARKSRAVRVAVSCLWGRRASLTEEGLGAVGDVQVREYAHPDDGKLADEQAERDEGEADGACVVVEHSDLVAWDGIPMRGCGRVRVWEGEGVG